MAQSLQIPNFKQANILERSTLAAEAMAGSLSLTVENGQGFEANRPVYLGEFGSETGEVVIPTVVAGQTLTIPATKHHHPGNSRATLLFATQVRIYRAGNTNNLPPAQDAFSLLAPVNLDLDQAETDYIDATGGSDYWYCYTYYNPTTASETSLAEAAATPIRGGSGGYYTTIDAIRQAAGFENARYITDTMIAPHRLTAQATVDGALSGKYQVPFSAPINAQIQAITAQLAAGYLLIDQYPNTPDRGKAKIAWAEAQLQRIDDGEVILLNAVGVTQESTNNPDGSGYPDASTQFEYGEARLFRISDVHNDYDRKY